MNSLWPFGIPDEEFLDWIDQCPVQWIRTEVAENSVTYKFIVETQEDSDNDQ